LRHDVLFSLQILRFSDIYICAHNYLSYWLIPRLRDPTVV
jgi:hypothetical protein